MNSDNSGVVSPAGQVAPPTYIKPPAPVAPAPTPPPYTQAQVDASLAANPNASHGGYMGPPMGDQGPQQQSSGNPYDSDPGYAAAKAAETLGSNSINGSLQNQIAQRIAAYGDPRLAEMVGFNLDPQAAAFARQNYLSGNSTLSRIDQAHSQARQAIINRLAAHGILFSGETGYQNGQEDSGYGHNVYDAQQQALADILGYRNSANSQIQGLHSQTIQALEQAYQNYINNPPTVGTGAATPPATTAPATHPAAVAHQQQQAAVLKQLVSRYGKGLRTR